MLQAILVLLTMNHSETIRSQFGESEQSVSYFKVLTVACENSPSLAFFALFLKPLRNANVKARLAEHYIYEIFENQT